MHSRLRVYVREVRDLEKKGRSAYVVKSLSPRKKEVESRCVAGLAGGASSCLRWLLGTVLLF